MRIIELDAEDLSRVAVRAGTIQSVKGELESLGEVRNHKKAKNMSDFETHYVGEMGEQAALKLVPQLVFDRRITRYGDGGTDCKLFGRSVQVKTVSKLYTGEGLYGCYVSEMSKFQTEFMIGAAIVSNTKVAVFGFVSKARFIKNKQPCSFDKNLIGVRPNVMIDIDRMVELLSPDRKAA
jgi:hypothetical protein